MASHFNYTDTVNRRRYLSCIRTGFRTQSLCPTFRSSSSMDGALFEQKDGGNADGDETEGTADPCARDWRLRRFRFLRQRRQVGEAGAQVDALFRRNFIEMRLDGVERVCHPSVSVCCKTGQ